MKQERKRMQPSTILFLLELVIYTNGLYFVFERARNASPHTAHSSVDKQWLSKMQYISSSLSCTWHVYSLAVLLFRAMWQSKPKQPPSPGKGRMLPALTQPVISAQLDFAFLWHVPQDTEQIYTGQGPGWTHSCSGCHTSRISFPAPSDRYTVTCLASLWTLPCSSCQWKRA